MKAIFMILNKDRILSGIPLLVIGILMLAPPYLSLLWLPL